MNYKNADDERIKKNRQAVDKDREVITKKTNLEHKTYSGKALTALAKGEYTSLKGNSYNKVPELKGNSNRPSTRYNQNVTNETKSTRDTRYDKDFDNFYKYREGDFSGEVDYDPKTNTDVEKWRNVKKDIMAKNKWSDKEFEDRYKEYSYDRYKKQAKTDAEINAKFASEHPILGTIMQAAENPGVWLEGASNMISSLLPEKYKAQSADDPRFYSSIQKTAEKQGVKENIKTGLGKTAYDIGTGLGDMVLASGIPVLGAATLGTETASRNQRNALERGVDPNKAALTGAATGVISGAMNKVGLDKALASNTVKQAAKKEGLENLLEDVVNLGLDKAINKNKSQLDVLKDYYNSQGMDDLSAWKQVIKDTGLDLATSFGTGALFGGLMKLPSLGKTPDVPNDPNVPELTGDPTVDNAIKQTVDAEAKIQENVTPNEGNVNRTVSNSTPRNPREIKPLEGERRTQALEERKANSQRIRQLNKDIKAQEEVVKNAPKKAKKAEKQKLDALKTEKTGLQSTNKRLGRQIDGAIIPMKEILEQNDKDLYDRIYKRNTGLMDNLNYVAKHAGDTAEAKQLAKDIKNSINEYVETGDINSLYSPETIEKINRLDDLARTTDAEYIGHYKDNALFTDENGNPSIWNALEGASEDDLGLTGQIGKLHDSLFDLDLQYFGVEKPDVDTTSAPIDGQLTPEEVNKLEEGIRELESEGADEPNTPSNNRIKEIDDNLAKIDEKLKQYEEQEPSNNNEEIYGQIKTIDEQLEKRKDLDYIIPQDELFRRTNTVQKARLDKIDNLYAEFNAINAQLENLPNMEIEDPNGLYISPRRIEEYRRNMKLDLMARRSAVYHDLDTMIKQYLLIEQAALRKELDANPMSSEDALSGNVRKQLQQTRERLLQEREGLVNSGSNGGDNVPPTNNTPVPQPTEPPIPENGNEVPNVKPSEPTPPGNNPPNNVPPNEPPKTNLSRRYETLKNSDLFKKSEANMKMLETSKEKGVFNKDIEGRQKAQDEALNDYLNDPEKARERNFNRQWDSGKDVDTSMLILKDALDKGDQADTNLTLLKQVENSKGAGRQLRAFRDYAGTKEHTLQKATEFMSDKADKVLKNKKTKNQFETIVERVIKGDLSDLSSKLNMDEANIDNIRKAVKAGAGPSDIVKMIGMYQAVGKTGISPEALKKISDIYDEIESKNLNPNSRERANLETDAFKVLAQDIGGKRTWKEQWDAWRYLAMLGNPKTHLRNILGNTTHYMVTEAKDNVGAVLEETIDKATKKNGGIERTKAILTTKDNDLVKRSALDADNEAYSALNDSGNKYNVKDEISRARDSFNNKTLSKVDEFNSSMLDKEDYSALRRKYSKSLARFLKANGADESIFDATDKASKELLDRGRAYAIDQAKQATFHEYSKLADALTTFSNNLSKSDRFRDKAASYAIEGLVPFKKTPINILKQGGKYSPISLAKGIYKAFDAVKTGNSSATEAIEDLASGLTGSGIMALGGFLASKGLLTGSANDNYDVDNAEKDQGAQNYALKIGNESYTLDWLAPMSMPLFVGVELYKQMQKKDENLGLNDFLSALTTIAEPITELSMLQGINDTLEQLSYSGLKSAVGTFAASTGLGYITQGIPTLAGQVARAIDTTRRSTYSDKTGVEKQIDRAVTKVENKLPFVSSINEPYINAKGNVEKNEGFFANKLGNGILPNLMDQMLSPGYYKNGTVTYTDKELNRLYEATGESPYLNVSSGKVQNEPLSKSDFTKYQTLYGQTNDKLYTDIIGSNEYKELDDAQRLKLLKSAKDMSKMIADHEIGGKELEKSEQALYDAYKSEGVDSLVNSLKEKAKVSAFNGKYGAEMKADTYEKWSTDPEKIKLGGAEAYAKNYQAAKALDMDVDDYIKRQQNYAGGAAQYAKDRDTVKAINEKYGSNYDVDDLKKKGIDGLEQRAQNREAALDYGFVNKDGNADTDAYEKAVSIVGNNDTSLKAYSTYKEQGFSKNNQRVPYLMKDNTLTTEQKGMIIAGPDPEKISSNTAKEVYKVGGYEGVWDYYMLKNMFDKDDSGGLNKKEKSELYTFMNSDSPYVTSIPDDVYYYLGSIKRW